ncbi:MAG: hypothetical protein ACU0CA_06430 [Paracoccaceae bacterium]
MAESSAKIVRKRRVFYIPGYDPFPPRRYRELYRKESRMQAEISGYDISVSARQGDAGYGWFVKAEIDGVATQTEVDVLVWSDLVQGSMNSGIAATYWQMLKTAWIYIGSGAMRRLMWLRKGPILAAFYPVAALLLQGLVAVLLGWGIGAVVSALIYPGAGWVAALPVMVLVLRWFRARDAKIYAYYLMHDYAFSASHRGANPPELEVRLEEFTKVIAEALSGNVDEVLVVGHSSGAHLAINIIADILRKGRVTDHGPVLALLSLGQVVPMISFLPEAQRLRRDLQELSVSDKISWVDVTAPGDGCSFALCDPVSVSGVATDAKRWPLVFSAAFTQSLSPERWNALKRRYFRLHFQYICAFDRPKDYDYFQITAGPVTLKNRYAGRPPSKSRIDISASPYTSVKT